MPENPEEQDYEPPTKRRKVSEAKAIGLHSILSLNAMNEKVLQQHIVDDSKRLLLLAKNKKKQNICKNEKVPKGKKRKTISVKSTKKKVKPKTTPMKT